MALTVSELIDEVKAAIGRDTDTVLITDTRVLRWLNKAQEDIAEKCAGLTALDFKNTTSVDFTDGQLEWPLSDWTSSLNDVTTENRICHIYGAYFDATYSQHKIQYIPLDDFDRRYIDPTIENNALGEPRVFTRRGNNLEIFPVCSTKEADQNFRLDGSLYPIDFTATTSSATSSLDRADDIMIAYAVFKSWSYVGEVDSAQAWLAKYNGLLQEYKTRNDTLHEWDANVYGEWI